MHETYCDGLSASAISHQTSLRLYRSRNRGRDVGPGVTIGVEHPSGDQSRVVDASRRPEVAREAGLDELLQLVDAAVEPDHRAAEVGTGGPHDLPARVDSQRLAGRIVAESLEVDDASRTGPEEGTEVVAGEIAAGRVTESDDIAARIDGHRRVPEITAEIPDVGGHAVVPEQGMARASASDGHVAVSGNPNHFAAVVDCRSGRGRVGTEGRQLLLRALLRVPEYCEIGRASCRERV